MRGQGKKTPKRTTKPTPKEIAWAAGFLEGEGCFQENSKGVAMCNADQLQKEPLERLQRWFGGSLKPIGKKPYWRWATCGSRARGVMMTIFSVLSPRRKNQILHVLFYKKDKRVNLYDADTGNSRS